MSDHEFPPEVVEAARALAAAQYGDVHWSTSGESYRTAWCEKVQRVMADYKVIGPIVAAYDADLRELIAQAIADGRGHPSDDVVTAMAGYPQEARNALAAMWHLGMDDAQRIARTTGADQ